MQAEAPLVSTSGVAARACCGTRRRALAGTGGSASRPDFGVRSPRAYGGSPVRMSLQVPHVDAVVEHAVAAGAKVVRPVADQFYGERSGTLEDPFGHVWVVSSHKEDVSADEMQRRWSAMTKR